MQQLSLHTITYKCVPHLFFYVLGCRGPTPGLSLKSPCLHSVFGACFHPLHIPSFSGICKVKKFQIWVWNAETQHLMHKVRESNYSRSSSQNIYGAAALEAGAQVKGKTRWNSVYHQKSSGKTRRSDKRKDHMKLSLPPKVVGKLVWVPVLPFLWNFHSQLHVLIPLLGWNWPFLAP
jgi:hypothetical protein